MAKGIPRRNGSGKFLKGVIPANKITLPREELKELYSKMGSLLIARHFNVSKPTVLRNLHDYNIKMRGNGAPSVMPEYWVKALHKPKAVPAWNRGETKETNLAMEQVSSSLKRYFNKLRGGNPPKPKLVFNQIYRARKAMATIGDIDLDAIKRRDRMVCCICGRKVAEKDLSFDHSVPLSLGGSHTQNNLRVAHRICNSRRGNGCLPVQIVLN